VFRPGLRLSIAASLAVLLLSMAVDIRAVSAIKPRIDGLFAGKPGFVPIGPRRYPPGYRAASFAWPNASTAGRPDHRS